MSLTLINTLPTEHDTTLTAARFHPRYSGLAITADNEGLVGLWNLSAKQARGRLRLPVTS
jgi:hypothetical protein